MSSIGPFDPKKPHLTAPDQRVTVPAQSQAGQNQSSIDPSSWLDAQIKTNVSNLNDAARLIDSICNLPATQRPDTTKVLELIDAKFASVFPVSREVLSNPHSKQYREVKPLVERIAASTNIKVLYTSPTLDAEMANSKKVVILQLDIHTDPAIIQRNYDFQKALYMSPELPMSSSLVEGGNDPSLVVSQIPRGWQAVRLMQKGVGPEAVIQYEFEQAATQSPNKAYVKYTAEGITESESIRGCCYDLITISAGAYPTFFPQEHTDSANHTLGSLTRHAKEANTKGLYKDFLVAFSLRLQDELDRMNVSPDLKKRLRSSSINVFMNYLSYSGASDPRWQQFYRNIPIQINQVQDDTGLRDYYKQTRFEYAIASRNRKIVKTISDNGPGTRAMIIGVNHVNGYFAKEARLVKLFEEAKIPVIVAGYNTRSEIDF